MASGTPETSTGLSYYRENRDLPGGTVDKNPPAKQGRRVRSSVWEDSTCCGTTKPTHHDF